MIAGGRLTRTAWLLIAGLSFSARAPEAGAAPAAARIADLSAEISRLNDLIVSPASHERVNEEAFQFSNVGLPSSAIAVRARLRGWKAERAPEPSPATLTRLLSTAKSRLLEAPDIPPPYLAEAHAQALAMEDRGRMAFERLADDDRAGEYVYKHESRALGDIKLNELLAYVAAVVGDAFAYATAIHEAAHAVEHMRGALSPQAVIAGEVAAFRAEYLYLKRITRDGEELATTRIALERELRRKPHYLTALALRYVTALDALYGTGGEDDKLKEYAERAGYAEGQSRPPDAPPSA